MNDRRALLGCRSRRGLTMMVAVALLALVAAGLVVLGRLAIADARRTGAESTGAQLRLLSLAGQRAAIDRLDATGALPDAAVPLPAELAPASLRLSGRAQGADWLATTIADDGAGHTLVQSLTLCRYGNHWTVRDASIR